MKTSIITRLCVLAASLCLFASVTGCLEMTPFPEAASEYTVEYYVDREELHVTFAPRTEIYDLVANIENFSGTITACKLGLPLESDLNDVLNFGDGNCNQLDSDEARSGNPVSIIFPNVLINDVNDCNNRCLAQIYLGVLVSGTMSDPNNGSEVILDNETGSYFAPHFNPGILSTPENEHVQQYLDLRTATVIEDCTDDNEIWNVSTSACVCGSGYERDSSTMACIVPSGSNPDPDPDPETDDTDGDGIPDVEDNCPEHVNYQQFDVDNDGIGNICDDNISSSQASEASEFGGGSCSLNVAANSAANLDVLPLLMVVSLIAIRRRFR